MKTKGLFVVGTDTGVGKTTISVALVATLREAGLRVAVMKPCETGGGDDAARLTAATGRELDPDLVNPYRFALPAAPEVAARREGARVDLAHLARCYRALAKEADVILVEGAGGLLVPLTRRATTVDLIARLDLPVLLVARMGLGTINHSLLTAEVAQKRGLRVLGLAFSRGQRRPGPEEDETVQTIVHHGGLPSFGVLPWLAASTRRQPARLASQVRQHLALDALWASLGLGARPGE